MHEETRGETRRLWGWLIALTVVTVVCRLMPYLLGPEHAFAWHLMPVGALALFVGSRLRSHWAYLVPVAAMFLSDLALVVPLSRLGYPAFSWDRPIVYASFALAVAVGRLIGRRELSPMVLGGAALLGSLQFFLVTNFAAWVADTLKPEGVARLYAGGLVGLGESYVAALPFFRNTVASDLLFTLLIFGLHGLSERLWLRTGATLRQETRVAA